MAQTLVSGVRLPERERERIEKLIEAGYYLNFADFLRDAVRGKLEEFEFSTIREVSIEKAEKEVLSYIRENPNIYADEVAYKLNLDIETVLGAVDELIKDGKIGEPK